MINYKLLIFLLFTFSVSGQTRISLKDSISIVKVLKFQEDAWNEGNINKFMEGYLKSDKIVFTGSNGSISVSYTHLPSPRDRTRSRMPSSA